MKAQRAWGPNSHTVKTQIFREAGAFTGHVSHVTQMDLDSYLSHT